MATNARWSVTRCGFPFGLAVALAGSISSAGGCSSDSAPDVASDAASDVVSDAALDVVSDALGDVVLDTMPTSDTGASDATDSGVDTIGASCLRDAATTELASNSVFDYSFDSAGHAIDTSGTYWLGEGEESTLVQFEGDHASCFSGGALGSVIDGGMPNDAFYECTTQHCGGACPSSCLAFHSAAGLGPDVAALQIIEDIEIRNSGDGISLEHDTTGNVLARRVFLHDLHDDAFESDFGTAGFTIEDSLILKVAVGFAMRLRSSASGDQRDQFWDIRNNLVRLHEFPNTYNQSGGHGNLFKLDKSENEPRFRFSDNVIVVGPDNGGRTLFPPVSRVEECSNNTYLFVGTDDAWNDTLDSDTIDDGGTNGERLVALNALFAGCFNVVVKPSSMSVDEFLTAEGWFERVATWRASHVAGSTGF